MGVTHPSTLLARGKGENEAPAFQPVGPASTLRSGRGYAASGPPSECSSGGDSITHLLSQSVTIISRCEWTYIRNGMRFPYDPARSLGQSVQYQEGKLAAQGEKRQQINPVAASGVLLHDLAGGPKH